MSDLDVIRDFDTFYNEAYYAWDSFYPLAERDLRFFLGDQWDELEKRQLFEEGRSTFVFNRIRRTINMVGGYQRKHRLSSVILPREDSDQLTADQMTKVMSAVMSYGNGYDMVSECFEGALKTGWNLMSLWMDYRDDPVNGDIRFGREPYNGFIVDPYFTKRDFSDCSYVIRRKYLSVDQVESLLPGQEKEVRDLYRQGWDRDDKFTWLPYQRQPNGQEMLAYSEMYQMKWRNVPMLVDMETGETTEFDFDKETLRMFLQAYPQLEVVQRPKQYIKLNVIVNDHAVREEINPYGLDEYPFAPFFSIFESESDQWGLKVQSLTRCMIDPQRESNRRRSQIVDIVDSQINSGWLANENSVINPRSLFQSGQGKVIWRREDAPPGAVEKIPPAQIPPSMFQMQELFDKDIMEIAGVNDAAFGESEKAGDSGVMMMLRQGASLVNLQGLFDGLRQSQQLLARKAMKMTQSWTPQKLTRIMNEEPTEQYFDMNLTKYDISVQEGVLTDTQKQMYFRQLIDLKQLGAPVTGEMLADAAPIQGASKYREQIAQMEQQQAQQEQEEKQIQMEQLDSQRQMAQAKAISDIALSKERFTRAVANMGLEDERASEAIQNRSQATLDRARAMKELDSMDDDRLVKYLSIVRMMEDANREKEEQIKADDVQISAMASEPSQNPPAVDQMMQGSPQQQPMGVQDGQI